MYQSDTAFLIIPEKDTARRNHIEAMKTYWTLYYGLRSLTQYDFERNCPLAESLPEI